MKIKINPLPDHYFVSNAKVESVGTPVKDENDEVIGTVIAYEIVEGRLILTCEIIDTLPTIRYNLGPFLSPNEVVPRHPKEH